MLKVFYTLIIILFIIININSQNINTDNSIDSEFELGISLFQSKQYNDAFLIFENLYNSALEHQKTTASYLMAARCKIELGETENGKNILNRLITQFPGTKFLADVSLVKAELYIKEKKYLDAFEELIYILAVSQDNLLINEAKKESEKIAVNYLAYNQVASVKEKFTSPKIVSFLLYCGGRSAFANNNLLEAEKSFYEIISKYPQSEEHQKAIEYYQKSKSNDKKQLLNSPVIAVLLPLMKNEGGNSAADEILDGVKFAVSEYNNNNERKIGLLIRDTKRSQSEIEKIAEEIKSLPSLIAVFGPIYSDEVRFTIDAFSSSAIPLISPTATDNDLTLIYDYFFQANPNFKVRGEAMAQYIYFVEGKRKIAVLNSEGSYAPQLAEAFINEFENIGGQIIIHQIYKPGFENLTLELSEIKKYNISLEGIYIPISDRKDVPILLSQFIQYGIDLPIYGNQDWFLSRGLETNTSIKEKLTFTSDYFIDYNSEEFKEFGKRFMAKTGKDVNRNTLYGYDAMTYILNSADKNVNSAASLYNNMSQNRTIEGFHSFINFDSSRTNKYLNIITYRNNVFELIDKFRVSN